MQDVLFLVSQFTDTRQDRPRRLCGGLQRPAREWRVRTPGTPALALREGVPYTFSPRWIPEVPGGTLGQSCDPVSLSVKEAVETSRVVPQRLRVQFTEVPSGQRALVKNDNCNSQTSPWSSWWYRSKCYKKPNPPNHQELSFVTVMIFRSPVN